MSGQFINFCQIQPLNSSEQLTIDSYEELESNLKYYIDKVYKLDTYGRTKESNKNIKVGLHLIYLNIYLNIVRSAILNDIQTCNKKSFDDYKKQYKLDCIKKHFACLDKGVDIDNLLSIYNLTSSTFFTGISSMAIGYDNTPICNKTSIFEVGGDL